MKKPQTGLSGRSVNRAMNKPHLRMWQLKMCFLFLMMQPQISWSGELRVQIRSPDEGSRIEQEQNYVLIGGKAFNETIGVGYVDIFLVLDVSGSTAQHAGANFTGFFPFPNFEVDRKRLGGRLPCAGPNRPGPLNLATSVLAAEIVASRRLLSQLNKDTSRVGVITFGEEARLIQPLTHDFGLVRSALDLVYKSGPYGGTNMMDAIRLATDELLGKGKSEKYSDSLKTLIFMTDGFPTRPTGDCTPKDAELAVDAARTAGKAGISIHLFALGEEALGYPQAALSIVKESGGTYTAVTKPADLLAVLEKASTVGVESIEVNNETIQQNALQSRLAADGFFASAVPVAQGLNRIQVRARAVDGSTAHATVTVHYEPGARRSLELEVFLEKERELKLEVERLRETRDEIH